MKEKSFLKNYLYSMAYQILVLIVPMITMPYISRVLGPTAIGDYGFTSGIVSYFGIFGALGTANYAQREIAFRQTNKSEYSLIFIEILFIRILMLSFVSFLFAIFIYFFGDQYLYLYKIQIITIIAWFFDITWLYQGLEDFKFITIRNILIKLLSTISIFIFVNDKTDLGKYAFILSFSILLGNVIAWPQLIKILSRVSLKSLKIKRHFKGILVMFASVLAIQLYTVLDQTLLGILSNTTEVGYYSQAQKVIKLALTVITSLATILLPRIAFLYIKNDFNKMNEFFKISINYLLFIAYPLMVGTILCSTRFVPVFFGIQYGKVVTLMQLLSVLYIILGAGQLMGSILVAINKQKEVTIVVCVGAIINIIMNLFLIPKLNSVGSVLASIITETFVSVFEFRFIKNIFETNFIINMSKNYLISSVFMGVIVYLTGFLNLSVFSTLICQVFFGMLSYFIALYILQDSIVITTIKKFKLR